MNLLYIYKYCYFQDPYFQFFISFPLQDMVRKNVRQAGSPFEIMNFWVKRTARLLAQIDSEYDFKEVLGEGSFGKVHKARKEESHPCFSSEGAGSLIFPILSFLSHDSLAFSKKL